MCTYHVMQVRLAIIRPTNELQAAQQFRVFHVNKPRAIAGDNQQNIAVQAHTCRCVSFF
jgi:hypothetical protein